MTALSFRRTGGPPPKRFAETRSQPRSGAVQRGLGSFPQQAKPSSRPMREDGFEHQGTLDALLAATKIDTLPKFFKMCIAAKTNLPQALGALKRNRHPSAIYTGSDKGQHCQFSTQTQFHRRKYALWSFADAPEHNLAVPEGGTIAISATYGYIRVSAREQNEDRQLIALRAMSIQD